MQYRQRSQIQSYLRCYWISMPLIIHVRVLVYSRRTSRHCMAARVSSCGDPASKPLHLPGISQPLNARDSMRQGFVEPGNSRQPVFVLTTAPHASHLASVRAQGCYVCVDMQACQGAFQCLHSQGHTSQLDQGSHTAWWDRRDRWARLQSFCDVASCPWPQRPWLQEVPPRLDGNGCW